MVSRFLICILLEPQNNESNLENIYFQLAERCEIFNFDRKPDVCNVLVVSCYSMKNILKWLISNLFLYEKTFSKRGHNTANFLFQYQSFYHISYQQTCQEPTAKAIFGFSLCALKIIVLIVGRKVLTYLLTFKFRGTHFWCNCKGKLNDKFLNNDTKNNNYTLQCINMITKRISDILIWDKIGIY